VRQVLLMSCLGSPGHRFYCSFPFVFLILGGICFAAILIYALPTDRNLEIRRVKAWSRNVDAGDNGQNASSTVVLLGGRTFGISTHVKVQSHGGWTFDGGRKANNFFAYPPGKEVHSIEEAFHLFDMELNSSPEKAFSEPEVYDSDLVK